MRLTRSILWGLLAAVLIAVGGLVASRLLEPEHSRTVEGTSSAISGTFRLLDHTGREVTEKTYDGKWRLVFFGYTFCPDICPTTLSTIADVMDLLGADAERVQPLFISIDPERDDVEAVAAFVKAFHPSIVGLTGTPEQIAATARSFRVYYARIEDESAPEGYLMDHSAFIYLMGPDGRFVTVLREADGAEKIAAEIRRRMG